MAELKPCPFCGGAASMLAPNMHRKTSVFCRECGASTKYGIQEEVENLWNRRIDNGK